MKTAMSIIILFFSTVAFGADVLPYRFEYNTGDVQAMNEDSLTYIDNSAVFLNPDAEGKHVSTFLYKSQDLSDVPYLEIRAKGLEGQYEFAVWEGKEWQPLGTITGQNKWIRHKFDMGNMLSDYANKDGIVKIRVRAKSAKTKSLELDYIGITTDKPEKKAAKTVDINQPNKTAEI